MKHFRRNNHFLQWATVVFILWSSIATAQKESDDNRFAENRNLKDRQEWLQSQGFGMFIHFNIDSQLGITISHSLVGASEQYIHDYYNELPKSFNPSEFDIEKIITVAKLAGVKYIVFTAKHHSGFCFWNTKTTTCNIMNTPYHKDLLKTYVDAVRAAGLGVGIYYSPEDFLFLHDHNQLINRGDMKFDKAITESYEQLIKAQTKELFSNYGKIDVFFIDGEPKEPCKEVAWGLQPEVVITRGAINTPEQTLPGAVLSDFWESNVTMGTQWNYKPTNDDLKSGTRLIELLIEARAKGGNFLLNISPHPDGHLPDEQENRLREIAAWTFINKEAIYNTVPWVISNEKNIWYTASKDKKTIYAVITGIPDWKFGDRKVFNLASVLSTPDTKISVLGQNDKIVEYHPKINPQSQFKKTPNGLLISVVRSQRVYDNYKWPNPIVVKLENIKPAISPPQVITLKADTVGMKIILKGVCKNTKTGENNSWKARFQYRPYAGFVENLYDKQWRQTPIIDINNDGTFNMQIKSFKPGVEYEYKAILHHPLLEVSGETKRVTALK